ncbi:MULTISPECIES: roadblock/LC7 domain-containing protein [Ralstonia solanacearum species complex]|uniref:Roadblock/LAMTOR2 domain-containing protein n=1 Tax=Ralstonia solanacearum (strain UW551) TaxID=342110 RepID=A0AB33VF30_RALSU|nr:roadblock/LC7 domain-containing protein [Ralstonia solanacearum]ALF89587.1 Roadblock/LC7 domain protein [Ralstonia solanacearum]ATI29115.1 hypothetical protein CCY86_16360 [Ralstonia solanacearum]EAP73449.1 Hypothetical Protein RRSL_03414 [Ralstonia solanacearum UW551]KEI31640.1 hypothetical protein CQ06_21735 [Ralstonia solanacearum]KFX29507.1 hypothetical protein KR96_07750 [Ralstonia solanacearum]
MNAPASSPVPAELAQAASAVLARYAQTLPELSAATLATLDGFTIASALDPARYSPTRLSAMTSTVMSVVRALGREVRFNTCNRLVLETDGGTMVFQPVGRSAIVQLCMTTGHGALLGRALWETSRIAEELAALPALSLLDAPA